MRDWKQWIDQIGRDLYNTPGAYQALLPELGELKQTRNDYRSPLKLDGTRPKKHRDEKTVILQRSPLLLMEHGEPAQNLISYLMDRDHTDKGTILKRIADLVGMELPNSNWDGWQEWQQRQQKKAMLETVHEYYQYCLQHAPEPIKDYLHNRFTDEEVEKMQLGYIASKQHLVDYLTSKGYAADKIKELADSVPYAVSSTHHITIPIYREETLYSFIYRHHNQAGTGDDKYKYHTGVVLRDMLQYIPKTLRKHPELIIVEGQLDCLHLLADGIKYVVATGNSAMNEERAEDAIKRGCRNFTLLFDTDPTDTDPDKNYTKRKAATNVIMDTARKMGLADQVKVYVADIPQPDNTKKIDPDSYIKAYGAAAVQELISTAQRGWQYELNHIANKLAGQQLTAKQLDGFNAAVLDIYDHIAAPMEQREYKNYLQQIYNGADNPTIERMLDEHQARRSSEEARKEAAEMMEQASRLMRSGDTANALELQGKAAARLAGVEAEQEYEKLMHRTTRAEIVEGLQRMPAALSTGLYLGKPTPTNEIILPAGALSILAAPTSHGKTTMLVAMAVEAARKHPDKEYYLLSYEEAQEPITIKALSSYAGLELSDSNRKTLQEYLTSGTWQYVSSEHKTAYNQFKEKEAEFFRLLEEGRLHIHYTDMVCENLCTSIRKLATAGRLGGVFIDYVQYIELASGQRNYQRHEEISKICRMLKDAAVETGTPIILAAQFNRDVADPSTVSITNLGEGGDIERKAAYCLGFWNNDMPYQQSKSHKPDMAEIAKLTKGNTYDPERRNKNKSIYAVVLKNRSGVGVKAGTTGLLSFDGNIGTIGNIEDTPSWGDQ